MNVLCSATMKGRGRLEKFTGAVREAWRPIDGVRNGCGDGSLGLHTPFIPPRWWEMARRGI
jgi:hypothetical protein